MDPRRAIRRASRLTGIIALIVGLATIVAPVTMAASRLNIDVTMPAGRTISGKVMNAAGTGLAGVSVFAYDAAFSDFAFATSNAQGNYRLVGLNDGSYTIQFSPPASSNSRGGYHKTAPPNNYTANSFDATAIVVPPNKTNINTRLPNGFSIAGKVTNRAGVAVPGVTVFASGPGFKSATTDSQGNYRITGLPAGSYRLQFLTPNGVNLQGGYYRNSPPNNWTANIGSATMVTVGPNRTNINTRLPSAFTISGVITRGGNVPLAGVTVTAEATTAETTTPVQRLTPAEVAARAANPAQAATPASPAGFGFSRSAVTDSQGRYTIRGLVPGDYTIEEAPPGNFQQGWWIASGTNHFTRNEGAASPVHVGPSKTGINMTVPAAFRISGKITNLAGAPVVGAFVSVSGPAGSGFAITNSQGNYVVIGLEPGAYKLIVQAPATSTLRNGWWIASGTTHHTDNPAAASNITVGPNKVANMKLPVGATIGDTVMGPGGTPLAGVFVTVTGPTSESAITNSNGKYFVRGLPTGTYTASFRAPFSGSGANVKDGFYRQGAPGNFTLNQAQASPISVSP